MADQSRQSTMTTEELSLHFEIGDIHDGWIYGRFYMLAKGMTIGDPGEKSVHMQGCLNWWRKFVNSPIDRCDPSFFYATKDVAYKKLASCLVTDSSDDRECTELDMDIFDRFHVSHLGMSSFDNATVLFLKTSPARNDSSGKTEMMMYATHILPLMQ